MAVTEIGTTGVPGRSIGQIKTRDRVRDLAEVYTHEREVNAMLDLVPDMFPSAERPDNHDRTFLEPACGHGNFLVEILRRKLSTVTPARYKRPEDYEHRVLRCVASVYGIDIDEENVVESRDRMRGMITRLDLAGHLPSDGFVSAVEVILGTNIVRADTLADGASIELVHYQPGRGGTFLREWSQLELPDPQRSTPSQLDLFGEPAGQLDLFTLESRCDARPVHYSDLAQHPDPVSR